MIELFVAGFFPMLAVFSVLSFVALYTILACYISDLICGNDVPGIIFGVIFPLFLLGCIITGHGVLNG